MSNTLQANWLLNEKYSMARLQTLGKQENLITITNWFDVFGLWLNSVVFSSLPFDCIQTRTNVSAHVHVKGVTSKNTN